MDRQGYTKRVGTEENCDELNTKLYKILSFTLIYGKI